MAKVMKNKHKKKQIEIGYTICSKIINKKYEFFVYMFASPRKSATTKCITRNHLFFI